MSGRRGAYERRAVLRNSFAAAPLVAAAPGGRGGRLRPAAAGAPTRPTAAAIGLLPDEAPLRNGRRAAVRQPPRPPIRVCVECLLALLEPELKAPERRGVAFEPGAEGG